MRVASPPLAELRWYLRPFFWLQRRRYGTYLTPATIWARVPALYLALAGFYAALERRGSPLAPGLRSLVQTRVSQLNHCVFCVDLNAAHAAQRSGSLAKALAVDAWRDADCFSAPERLALEYAEAMTLTQGRVSDALSARLAGQFGEAALIELTALIGFQNLSSKFNAALDIASQGLCPLPKRPDPPTGPTQERSG
ncbi:MAG: carboxymuconolactone decarboxylase family protein [Burkholderiaceae bacterium]